MAGDVGEFARAIQLALAPAFLLTGVAALINVMTGRLARIIDRGKSIVREGSAAGSSERASLFAESRALEQRRHLTSVAIILTTITALLVCLVIAALFVEVMLEAELKWVISPLFAAAMLALVGGLTFFLREVHLAIRTVRIVGPDPFARPSADSSRPRRSA